MSMVEQLSKPALFAALGLTLLGACSPRDMETSPVEVETAKGKVICQLYTHDMVYWDRSIQRPDGMSGKEADAVCVAKGRQLLEDTRAGKA